MKRFIIICMMALSFGTFAQEEEKKVFAETSLTQTERIVDKYSDKVATAISSLAKSLEVPAGKVWEILIKQQYVFAVSHAVIIIICFLLIFYFWHNANKWAEDASDELDVLAPIWIFTGAFAVYFVFAIYPMIGCFINPEYQALQEILELIK